MESIFVGVSMVLSGPPAKLAIIEEKMVKNGTGTKLISKARSSRNDPGLVDGE